MFKDTVLKLYKNKVHVGYLSVFCNGVEGAVTFLNLKKDAILGFYEFDDYEIDVINQEKPKTVKEILIDYLTANGYDGLCNDGCGCGIDPDEFMICAGEDWSPCFKDCVPAHLGRATESTEYYDKGDWIYSPDKPESDNART